MDYIKPAICCLGYDRPESLNRLLKSIHDAIYDQEDITLVISIDESPKSDIVEDVARTFSWEHGKKIVRRFHERQGTIKHTLKCGDLSEKYGSVIYLEDDVIVSPGYYIFLENALKKYGNDDGALGVALYSIKWNFAAQCVFTPLYNGSDVYKFYGDISWGQCWTKKGWSGFKRWLYSGQYSKDKADSRVPLDVINWPFETSWSRAISFYMAQEKKYYIVPYYSYSTCISDKGQHTSSGSNICQVPLSQKITDRFSFSESKKLIAYDQFYELIVPDGFFINGIDVKHICFDINGLKYDYSGFQYLLSSKIIKDYKIISSFSNSLEPTEENVFIKLKGNGIFLYEISENKHRKRKRKFKKGNIINPISYRILDRMSLKCLITYCWKRAIKKVLTFGNLKKK